MNGELGYFPHPHLPRLLHVEYSFLVPMHLNASTMVNFTPRLELATRFDGSRYSRFFWFRFGVVVVIDYLTMETDYSDVDPVDRLRAVYSKKFRRSVIDLFLHCPLPEVLVPPDSRGFRILKISLSSPPG